MFRLNVSHHQCERSERETNIYINKVQRGGLVGRK